MSPLPIEINPISLPIPPVFPKHPWSSQILKKKEVFLVQYDGAKDVFNIILNLGSIQLGELLALF